MKKPTLYITSLPNLYKNCSSVLTLHIQITDKQTQSDKMFDDAYLEYVRNQMYTAIEAFFVTAQASKVFSKGELFIVFKSNITKKILVDFIHALFAELSVYCEQQVELSYQYLEAILYEDGRNVSFLKANKIGDDLSNVLQDYSVFYDGKAKPRGKQLSSIEEYRNLSSRLKLTKKTVLPPKKEDKEILTVDETQTCEYYI